MIPGPKICIFGASLQNDRGARDDVERLATGEVRFGSRLPAPNSALEMVREFGLTIEHRQWSKYHANLFWSEPDGMWVANVPDLQWCSAFGDTPAEALSEFERAIEACLAVAREDGLPIPASLPRADSWRRLRP